MTANWHAGSAGNELHRSVKLALDSGEVASVAEAQTLFEQYRLCISVGPDVARSPTKQAALLTMVNTARRCFLGGVTVAGQLDVELLIPWRHCRSVAEAVCDLQGTWVETLPRGNPLIVVGDGVEYESAFAVRASFDGWRGGVLPLTENSRLNERHEFAPAGVLAGALAVSEAFQFVRGSNVQAGRRAVGLSLWQPEVKDWRSDNASEPELTLLPARLWLIGLGHLGQAYLWTLGLLPYSDPTAVQLVLQDFDTLVPANDSTSPLTKAGLVGQKKTRALAAWCEQRGFTTRLNERRFAANFRVAADEPLVALCGVDNEAARAVLEDIGFAQIIEAGLGRGTEEYLSYQMHCFPSSRSARQRWGSATTAQADSILEQRPAYQTLAAEGLDKCGLTLLANRAVGASFVGTFTATLVIAELLRLAMGAHRYEVIDGSLRSPDHSQAVSSSLALEPFNPGLTRAASNMVIPTGSLSA